ncbi:MAG: conotoxin [Solirubrobacterales bacterium]|nr:conotoxin [Solirubrobacterales bacterium]
MSRKLTMMMLAAVLLLPATASAERVADSATNGQGIITEASMTGPDYLESDFGRLGSVNIQIRRDGVARWTVTCGMSPVAGTAS